MSTNDLIDVLAQQNANLQGEIIDFLLRWEEDDDTITETGASASGNSNSSNNNNNKSAVVKNKSKEGGKNMRETVDVLDALKSVDNDLEAVDAWLGDQIDQLNSVQSKLYAIESSLITDTCRKMFIFLR